MAARLAESIAVLSSEMAGRTVSGAVTVLPVWKVLSTFLLFARHRTRKKESSKDRVVLKSSRFGTPKIVQGARKSKEHFVFSEPPPIFVRLGIKECKAREKAKNTLFFSSRR